MGNKAKDTGFVVFLNLSYSTFAMDNFGQIHNVDKPGRIITYC